MAGKWARGLAGMACLVQMVVGAVTEGGHPDYTVDGWRVDEGLPHVSVSSLAQTPDGYLWLATFNGLVRFDGVRFRTFDDGNTPEFGSSRMVQVAVASGGGLWVVTESGGLIQLDRGRWRRWGLVEGVPAAGVQALVQDAARVMYAVDRAGGWHRFEGGRFAALSVGSEEGGPEAGPTLLFTDNGPCWVGHRGGAALARFTPLRVPVGAGDRDGAEELRAVCATPCRAGGWWVATERGVYRFREGRFEGGRLRFPEPLPKLEFLLEEGDGGFLLGSWDGGLLRWAPPAAPQPVGLSADPASPGLRALLRDREGNLWVGTDNQGLYRLKPRLFRMVDGHSGLTADPVTSLCVDRHDRVWIGLNGGGLNRWEAGQVVPVVEPPRLRRHPLVYSVLADRMDGIWLGLYGRGVLRLHGETLEAYTLEEGYLQDTPWVMFEDQAGAVWLGGNLGLRRVKDGEFTLYTQRDGLGHDAVSALAEDRAGTLYIGTRGGGLTLRQGGRFRTYTDRDGLADQHIAALLVDREDTLWIGTVNGGLCRFKNGRFARVTERERLPSNTIGALIEDGMGGLWGGSNRGIFRLELDSLNACLDGRGEDLSCQVFNRSDGLNTVACTGTGQPAAGRTRDGRLWFSTAKGVAVVDPRQLPRNPLPPPVVIEEVLLDDRPQALPPVTSSGGGAGGVDAGPLVPAVVTVPSGTRRVSFHFTGLSLVAPEKVRFRHRLEGLESEWTEAGLRREARYLQLPPGRYEFRVTAANNDGVWNGTGARLGVVVLPAWWQTWWFRGGGLVATAGLVAGLVEARLRRMRREQTAQQGFARRLIESQEAERQRIAGELHDSLGQELLIIKNRALLGMRSLALPAATGELSRISDAASRSLDEIREITRNLRPYQLDRLGLTRAIQTMITQVAEASGLSIAAEVDPVDGMLPPALDIHFFRIVQELVTNVVKHSDAASARVSVRRLPKALCLVVADDGRGFSVGMPQADAVSAGTGLGDIAERVRLLGGRARCESRPAAGTSWMIEIPAPAPEATPFAVVPASPVQT